MSKLVCWNCGENLDDLPRPISRHANCPKCFNEVHCCRLCCHFDPNNNMRCFEDRADPPLNKENANFCDFFAPAFDAFQSQTAIKSTTAQSQLDALFGQTPVDKEDIPAATDDQQNTCEPEPPLDKEALTKKKLDDLFG